MGRKAKTPRKSASSKASRRAAAATAEDGVPLATLDGYAVLPVSWQSGAVTRTRSLFFRKHITKGNSRANAAQDDGLAHALFVCNLPRCFGPNALRAVFERFGKVTRIVFGKFKVDAKYADGVALHMPVYEFAPPSEFVAPYKSGFVHIAFSDEEGVQAALHARVPDACGVKLDAAHVDTFDGFDVWMQQHLNERPGAATLKASVEDFMTAFDEAEEAKRLEEERLAAQVDEDGFQLVTRTKGGATREQQEQFADESRRRKKRARRENEMDFYRFQAREKNRAKLIALRKKYEEDKARIQALKAKRKFRPM